MSSVTVTETAATVTVTTTENLVTVQQSSAPGIITAVTVGPQGPTGPKGDSGGASIGGYDVSISNIAVGDILAFSGTTWFNDPQAHLTDGGNF